MSEVMESSAWSGQVMPWVIKAALALVIFYVGRKLAKWLSQLLEKRMLKAGLDDMLAGLVGSTAYIALLAVVVLAALEQLGVNTTSALAIFGAAGLAVGLAVKDSLSNFAAGVMIVFFKPFEIGHYVEAAGTSGSVVEVGMFNSTLVTPDNKRVVVPNRLIYNDTIVNYSAEENRRVDMVFGIGYDDDISKVRRLIEAIIADDERILKDPVPTVAVNELADSSVNFVVRPWVKGEDYWAVRFDMIEKVKQTFDDNGISIPFPQQDVHMRQVENKAA